MNYRNIPALAAYIDRVGAEELNFRRFIIKEYHGNYYKQKAIITITQAREIVCNEEQYAPTEEEAAAINAALVHAQFPKSIDASEAQIRVLRELLNNEGELYLFYDQATMHIKMVQQRIDPESGDRKIYKPWTYWSDGEWRNMEPDGALPFWKPRIKTNKVRFMIHEGAKAADAVTTMLADPVKRAAHPWAEWLDLYEHWGMIGGALSPHRADYAELRSLSPSPVEVVYVCDNDKQGKEALAIVSRMWHRGLKGIYFDDRWKSGWDMADPLPDEFFYTGSGKYKGPDPAKLMFSATWATTITPSGPRGGKPSIAINDDFIEEWLHCVTPEVYIHKTLPHIVHNADEFNNLVRPFSDALDTARILMKSKSSKTGALKYVPAETSGFKAGRGEGSYVNTHTPSALKPLQGDPQPWLDFMTYMVPDQTNRTELLRWIATLIARPDIKMMYGVLLISEKQGIGKGTLGEKVLLPIIGQHNCSVPQESEVVDSNFNYWAAHHRLAIIHEIYAGQSSKAYNKMKSIVTDRYINVNKKFQAGYEIENWLHIFACSNSLRALQLSVDDRRWLVPKITEEKKPYSFWRDFNNWLGEGDGLRIIMWWCHEWLKTNAPVMEGADAPMTNAKREVVEEGFSPGQQLVLNFLQAVQERNEGRSVFMLDTELQQMIRDHLYEGRANDRVERTRTIRKVAEQAGWHVNPDYARLQEFGTRAMRAKIITNDPALVSVAPQAIAAMTQARIHVRELAQEWFARTL